MRWKALAEIYIMHSFAPFSKINFLFKIAEIFAKICQNLQKVSDICEFVNISPDFGQILAEINLPKEEKTLPEFAQFCDLTQLGAEFI